MLLHYQNVEQGILILKLKHEDGLFIIEGTAYTHNHDENSNNIWIDKSGNLVVYNKTTSTYSGSYNVASVLNLEELKQIVLIMETLNTKS